MEAMEAGGTTERLQENQPRTRRGVHRTGQASVLHGSDWAEWSAKLALAGADDVFFSRDYLLASETALGGAAECFVHEERGGIVVYPYIRRPIAHSPYFDITTPYGFGGYVKGPRDAVVERFQGAFAMHCRETGIVSEFVRFHPLLGNHAHIDPAPVEIGFHQSVVCSELTAGTSGLPEPAIAKDAKKKVRKARDAGIEVIDDCEGRFFGAFIAQYHQTMERKGACSFYFFPETFYESIRRMLGTSARLLIAVMNGRMVGGLLLLYGDKFAHNFLSCSEPSHRSLGTNDLLQVEALKWASRSHKERYLLGGGRSGEDSLFQYKARFASGRAGFFLGRRIHLPEIYRRLSEERMSAEPARPEEFWSRSYFPLYRSGPQTAEEIVH